MILQMNLLSETIFSSGEGVGNIVDINVVYDELGIPYIPSKRIKGVLREYGEELMRYGEINPKSFERIFGKSGSKESASLKLSNGYLYEYENLRNTIKYINSLNNSDIKLKPEYVADYFTLELSQTAIENGVAKEKSLRTIRALRKGLTFNFYFELDDDLLEDFKKICKVSKHFGLSRSRGFGWIKLDVIENEQNNKNTVLKTNTDKIGFYIKAKEPLVFYDPISGSNVSLNYVPSSSIHGFFANEYIKTYGTDSDFYDIFIKGKVKFLPAYPKNSLPTPLSLMKKKDSNEFYDMTNNRDVETVKSKDIQTKEFGSDFVVFEEEKPRKVDVERLAVYHHRRPENKKIGSPTENDGEFYQFEVIKRGNEFFGIIEGEPTLVKKISSVMPKHGKTYIGKSKTAQYGAVEYELKPINETLNKITWSNGESLIFYFFSDAIILNDFGFNSCREEDILKQIKEALKLEEKDELKVEKSFINERIVGGYLSVWNLPKIQKLAVSKGSVIKTKNNTGKTITFDNNSLYLGIRNSEGFGKVIAIKSISELEKLFQTIEEEKEERVEPKATGEIIEMLIKYTIDKELSDMYSKIKENPPSVTNSFISKMIELVIESNDKETFERKLTAFKKPARKNLKLITDYLKLQPPKDMEQNKDPIIIRSNWSDFISERLSGLSPAFKPNETQLNDFNFYKRYALGILRYILYLNKTKNEQ